MIKRKTRSWKTFFMAAVTGLLICGCGILMEVYAAGTLTPVGAGYSPVKIEDHNVKVTINNGFAITEVVQTFFNPNNKDLEAIYTFPLPKSASLSEVTVTIGEREIKGEVIPKEKAKKIYEEERDRGNESGLASKKGYKSFDFRVSPVRAKKRAVVRFVYYQPLEIDTGIGRYAYPLEEGGTDSAAGSFWTTNSKVEGMLAIDVELKSAYPLSSVRTPGYSATVTDNKQLAQGTYKASYEITGANLSKDFIFYYRFKDNLPGRIELIPYRKSKNKPGSFMMVVTPGLDLKPLSNGADYLFVLDTSGSMSGKIKVLTEGVVKALGKMSSKDRFRIITFEGNARELTSRWVSATPANVKKWAKKAAFLRTGGGTNLYNALKLCLGKVNNEERATSVILVTDAVTNTGTVDPRAFHKLMKKYDVRVFGFVMGNGANWPLMRTVCNASGGFYSGVSNSDDIIGQILKAKNKVTYECLHNAVLKIRGVDIFDMTDLNMGKVYQGEQLVFFGRYKNAGKASVALKASLTGKDKTYATAFEFPEIATENPEIERLWALNRIEMFEDLKNTGLLSSNKANFGIRKLGVEYQLVTDETSMLVLKDDAFQRHGIKRRNLQRTAVEHQARQKRSSQPVRNYRVDREKPAFRYRSSSYRGGGGGGGAIDPLTALLFISFGGLLVGWKRRRRG
ncbi:MAG: VWA domain-containing protein [bacterium]|nr:VWA domain-containing protein [bacterium]